MRTRSPAARALACGSPASTPHILTRRNPAASSRAADARFRAGAKLPSGRDEYLDLTALTREDEETLALSSTARSPVRVTVEVPRGELEDLAILLDSAQQLIEELRQGLGLVPDSLPDLL